MTKKQKQSSRSQRDVEFFCWPQKKEYTVLEDFIVRILEKGACADSKIAEILCLEEPDIAIVMHDLEEEYSGDVQGDSSLRSLCDNFSRSLPVGVAIAVGKQLKEIEKITAHQSEEIVKFFDQFHDRIESNGRHEKFRKEHGAKRYVLKISFYHDRKDTEFHLADMMDDIKIPEVLAHNMERLLGLKGKPSK